ncbi:MAG TPA: glycosyltransferase family 39 protein [Pirellulales bacterium]|nr:glycosyltransferase family 39 protein [Pirellulales bacterium]
MLSAPRKMALPPWWTAAARGMAGRAIRKCLDPRYLLAGLVLLGGLARLRQYFARTSYWHDEAFLLLNVFQRSFFELAGPLSHDQAAPPVFLWILRACYLAAGPSELAMRLPALSASLAALVLMVPLARTVVGKSGSVWAVGCACLSSCLLHLSYQVKPYTTDVLVAEAVLLATAIYLQAGDSPGRRRASGLALLTAALVGPWLSFPSAFTLAGAAMAVLVETVRSGGRRDWAYWVSMQIALLTSCAGLWLVAARHHNTPYQQTFWAVDFVDLSSIGGCLGWLASKLIEAGNYGVQGTGLPVAILAAIGLATCARRQPRLAVLLVAPACLACLAAALRQYPLGNRLLAFLLPSLWLTAAYGLDSLAHLSKGRVAWAVPALSVLVLLAGGVRTAMYAVVAKPSVEFRQAFDYVHHHWGPGDSLWVSQPAVYEAYFGRKSNLVDGDSPPESIERAARRGRVWMVCHPPAGETARWDAAREAIESFGAVEVDRLRFVHLDVGVFAPPPSVMSAQKTPTLGR